MANYFYNVVPLPAQRQVENEMIFFLKALLSFGTCKCFLNYIGLTTLKKLLTLYNFTNLNKNLTGISSINNRPCIFIKEDIALKPIFHKLLNGADNQPGQSKNPFSFR